MALTNPTNDKFPKAREALERILEQSLEGIAIIGEDKRIEYINDRACEIIGRTRDEVIGQSFQGFVHQDSSDFVIERYASRLNGELIPSTYEARVLYGDHDARDVRIQTTVLTNGESEIKILAQLIDITEEKRFQRALSEREMVYHTLIKTMNEGIGVIDDHGVFVQSNKALGKMLGYSEEDLSGMTTADIMHGLDGDALSDKIRDRIAGKSERYETHLIHRSGTLIPAMVSAAPIFSDCGEYAGSCVVITDITKQKIIERNLQTARRRAELYLDLMKHDIRNNLQEIQISAELLGLNVDDSSVRDFLESILRAVSKSTIIISNSRTIDQLTELPLRERLLDEVLCESMKDASILLEDVVISLSLHVSNALIRADDYLELLLSDLLANAYYCNPAEMKRIWVDLEGGKNVYELLISDNGPGLSDSVKQSLFNPDSRIEGVGFLLAHHIVEKYEGTIEVHDRVPDDQNQGKKIRVIFPRLDKSEDSDHK
ncbi:MAG: PAS domain-containing sensor histidine kinase [Candidatus Thorarchaeota archaeon]|jgi:PAS domain S-box-containing protein